MKSNFTFLLCFIFLSIRVRMSFNLGDYRNRFLKRKSKLGISHVPLTTPKTSPKTMPLSVVEMQKLPHNETTDSKGEVSCLIWTK